MGESRPNDQPTRREAAPGMPFPLQEDRRNQTDSHDESNGNPCSSIETNVIKHLRIPVQIRVLVSKVSCWAAIEEWSGGCLHSRLDSLVFAGTFSALREWPFFDVTKMCCDGCYLMLVR
jgi:hypothetical protein